MQFANKIKNPQHPHLNPKHPKKKKKKKEKKNCNFTPHHYITQYPPSGLCQPKPNQEKIKINKKIKKLSTKKMPHISSSSARSSSSFNPLKHTPSCTHRLPDSMAHLHDLPVGPDQCSSTVIQTISAPASTVWALLRRFDSPQSYKRFVKSCRLLDGDSSSLAAGCLREVRVISGIPAVTSTERLEILDDEKRVMSFRIVGGEHRLSNYRSVTTVHDCGAQGTTVVESYVVDVPAGNTVEDTCVFVDTIVRCNLQSLAMTVEKLQKCGRAN